MNILFQTGSARGSRACAREIPAASCCIVAGFAAATVLALTGCATGRSGQVESAAKDWSRVVRASQVIPVYPLTEDLQPGDVFLVEMPVERQQKLYDRKGYLPLDNHIARLHLSGYEAFYRRSFLTSTGQVVLPLDWMDPQDPHVPPWGPAPKAAFPTHTFTVRRGAGLSLAVPVQGVPIGLSLLGTDALEGTLAIRQAATLGVDLLSAFHHLQVWAAGQSDFLRNFGTLAGETNQTYLRMVTRIYVAGEVEINLIDTSSSSAEVSGSPLDALLRAAGGETNVSPSDVITQYSETLRGLNEMLDSQRAALGNDRPNSLPGGSVHVTAAAARSVSLRESFPRPLVIGYLGFDCAIRPGGTLGPPLPTYAVLEKQFGVARRFDSDPILSISADALNYDAYRLLKSMGDNTRAAAAVRKLDGLGAVAPAEVTSYQATGSGADLRLKARRFSAADLAASDATGYERFRAWWGELSTSISSLERALKETTFQYQPPDGSLTVVRPETELRSELEDRLDKLRQNRDNRVVAAALAEAHSEALAELVRVLSSADQP